MSPEYHWWIITRDEDGKPYLLYGDREEEKCRQRGLELLGGLDFEIKRLKTRNLQTASAMVRGVRLEKTRSLKEASKRLGHDKSVKRLLKHRRSTV